jgi:hypothetical protein
MRALCRRSARPSWRQALDAMCSMPVIGAVELVEGLDAMALALPAIGAAELRQALDAMRSMPAPGAWRSARTREGTPPVMAGGYPRVLRGDFCAGGCA